MGNASPAPFFRGLVLRHGPERKAAVHNRRSWSLIGFPTKRRCACRLGTATITSTPQPATMPKPDDDAAAPDGFSVSSRRLSRSSLGSGWCCGVDDAGFSRILGRHLGSEVGLFGYFSVMTRVFDGTLLGVLQGGRPTLNSRMSSPQVQSCLKLFDTMITLISRGEFTGPIR